MYDTLCRISLLLLSAVLWAGCGPMYSYSAINRAELSLEAASLTDGDQHAPFEHRSAELYLQKAREKQNYSQYGAARRYATKSSSFAEMARMKALDEREERERELRVRQRHSKDEQLKENGHLDQ